MNRIALSILALAAASGTAFAQNPNWPKSLTLTTASPGGTFAVYGQGVAAIISDVVKVPTSTMQTQGPNQNVVLLQQRRAEVGMTTMGPAYEAWNGTLVINKDVKHTDIRALFPMYETPFHVVSLQKGGAGDIKSMKDLNGKTVGFGPAAGTPGVYMTRWFKDLGINVTARFGQGNDMASQLGDGRLDAFAFGAGLPIPAFSELDTTQKVNFFGYTDEEIKQIMAKAPYVAPFTIKAGTYKQQTVDNKTLSMWNFGIAHKTLPEDLAYAITKAILENNARMVQTHSAAVDTLAKNATTNRFLPFHPGAARYYKEIGVAIDPGAAPQP
ncbi:C4-dicarboxylate ABC transporter substrate-binding protein [Allostella vacuolata]|nr:C4-dicarboxylate ABC transporter substrate-binding protein [Stella vacuolata]